MNQLEFAALLCSRLCHDLISPVAALSNGLEVLGEEEDEGMRAHAMEVIGASLAQARARLIFARLAYGAATSMGKTIALEEARAVAADLLASTKATLSWDVPEDAAPKDQVRLLLNLVLLGSEAVPRGGEVAAYVRPGPVIGVRATGKLVVFPPKARQALEGALPEEEVDGRLIQPTLTRDIATSIGFTLEIAQGPEELRIEARRET